MRRKAPEGIFEANIIDLAHDGRGVARINEKVVFIEGALPDETVKFQYIKVLKDYDEAEIVEVIKPSKYRVEPICSHFVMCGGCKLQHLQVQQQLVFKEKQMLHNLKSQAKVVPEIILPALQDKTIHYRNKARIGVKNVEAKGRVLVGFREKKTPYVVEMESCLILHERVSHLIMPISDMIARLSIPSKIPQIEIAVSDDQLALSFRVMVDLNEADTQVMLDFAQQYNLLIYIQPGHENTTYGLNEQAKDEDALNYTVDHLKLSFKPFHFTQVNPEMNRLMIRQALSLLALKGYEHVLDLFCGLGNFTLALSQHAKQVTGVEGDQSLVEWAQRNAQKNDIVNIDFYCADLTKEHWDSAWMQKKYDAILVDPPRSGALEMMPYLGKLAPEKILYISCHPATLARDLAVLQTEYGYALTHTGVMDMFPHTAHVESMALLVKANK